MSAFGTRRRSCLQQRPDVLHIMQRKGAGLLLCMQVIEGAAEQRRFEALYAAYHRRMLALARRKLPTQEDAEDAAGTITGCFPEAEVSVVDGGQPVYYYMISVE